MSKEHEGDGGEAEAEAELSTGEGTGELVDEAEELPIVARMVVEIRSDGRRTVARGAVEDRLGGQSVGVEARADSPLELSRALAKMLLSTPAMLARGARSAGAGGPEGEGEAEGIRGRIRAGVAGVRRRLGDRLERELARRLGADED